MVITNDPLSRRPQSDALFRGYTRKARAVWWILLVVGTCAILRAAYSLLDKPADAMPATLLGLALAGISGAFAIRLGKRQVAYSFGDFYLLLMLFSLGTGAATFASALEAFVSARVSSQRRSSRLVSPAIQATCMLATGTAYESLATMGWFSTGGLPAAMAAAMVAALIFGTGMAVLPSLVLALNRKAHADVLVAGAYITSVVVTALVASTVAFAFRDALAPAMLASVPLIAAIIAFVHLFRRHFLATIDSQRRETDAWKRSASATAEQVVELRASEQRLSVAFRDAAVGAALLRLDGTIVQANVVLCELLGRPESTLVHTDLASHVGEQDRDLWRRHLRRAEGDASPHFSAELRFDRSDGGTVWLGVHCSAFTDPQSGVPGLIFHANDNTARREAELSLQHVADHDPLTGLPNQRCFKERLAASMNAVRLSEAEGVAVMFVDFDGFKAINDRFGHAAGDQFLVEMARRMCSCVRPGDLVGRLGGDEFAILVRTRGMPEDEDLASLATRVIETLAVPCSLSNREVSAGVSIGICADASCHASADSAISDADRAMYEAKQAGKRRFAFGRAS